MAKYTLHVMPNCSYRNGIKCDLIQRIFAFLEIPLDVSFIKKLKGLQKDSSHEKEAVLVAEEGFGESKIFVI